MARFTKCGIMMVMEKLREKQIKRQDFVDNQIFELIQRLAPSTKIKWDIEMIGNVRDSIQMHIVNKQKSMSEAIFYPYLKIRNLTAENSKSPRRID